MNAFINFATVSNVSAKLNACEAISEVMEQITSPADGDYLGDACLVTTELTSLKTVSVFPAYSNVEISVGSANLYLAYKHHATKGAVEAFIVEFLESDETWILEDVSCLWDKIVADIYAQLCATGNALRILDWKESFTIRKENAARK